LGKRNLILNDQNTIPILAGGETAQGHQGDCHVCRGAYVMIELANNVVEPLNLPEWTPKLIIIIALGGFLGLVETRSTMHYIAFY